VEDDITGESWLLGNKSVVKPLTPPRQHFHSRVHPMDESEERSLGGDVKVSANRETVNSPGKSRGKKTKIFLDSKVR
jgi:hypothetical protein